MSKLDQIRQWQDYANMGTAHASNQEYAARKIEEICEGRQLAEVMREELAKKARGDGYSLPGCTDLLEHFPERKLETKTKARNTDRGGGAFFVVYAVAFIVVLILTGASLPGAAYAAYLVVSFVLELLIWRMFKTEKHEPGNYE